MIEVKSSTKTKPVHEPDLAVQLYVLQGCGLNIRRACLLHLDTSYVYQGGDYDLDSLFTRADLTRVIREQVKNIPTELERMRAILSNGTEPDIDVGPQCYAPYECPFVSYCHEEGPEFPITEFPRIRQRLKEQLAAAGIEDIRNVPEDFPDLSPLHQRVRQAVVSGEPFIDQAIKAELAEVAYPIHFMDFETFMPALPLYAGTRPYQTIPFQWSVHILDEQGKVEHKEFLHEGNDDPRRPFAETLLGVLGSQGSIVVYSGYENRILGETAAALPDHADQLDDLTARLFDLLPVLRNHVYHPEFHGSFSIKAVLPALVPGLGYDGMAISDGGMATVAFAETLAPETSEERREELKAGLRAYCKMDTYAMVELFRHLAR